MREQPRPRSELGILGLMLAAVVLGTVGLFLADYREVPFGSFASLVWLVALFVSFTFGFLYYAQFVLPLKGQDGWAEGFRLLWRHYTQVGQSAVSSRSTLSSSPKAKLTQTLLLLEDDLTPRLVPSFTTLGAGFVKSHEVLALAKGTGFSRPAGPGFVLLYRGEGITHIVDLRLHQRQQTVKAATRDGIPIETTLTVSFRVKQSLADHLQDEGLPYPYEKDAIFHVTYAHSIEDGEKLKSWPEQLCPRGATVLVTELAKYTLNELYQRDDAGLGPLDNVREEVHRELEKLVDHLGVEILGVGISKLGLPSEIMEQRIRAWQAEWERQIQIQRATGEAEAMLRLKRARARAQIEIIENITQNIEAMRRVDDRNLTEIITLRMIEAMEEAMGDISTRATLPQPVMSNLMDVSRRMLAWMNQPEEGKP